MLAKEKAIEILQELWKYKETDKYTEAEIRQALDMASNALEQESKIGHWINRHIIANTSIDMIVCSECGEEFSYDMETGISEYNYCPNCGAEMR